MSRLAAFVAALMFSVSAVAVPITVHNTGVNSSDVLVGMGGAAAFWTLLSKPALATEAIGSGTFRFHHPAYAADTGTAAWVAPAADGNAGVLGVYTYGLTIDLTGFDLSSVVISGQFSTDNDGFINVNGGANTATTGFADFVSLHSFTLNSGFVAGLNTIQVGANNGGDPTAFIVQFSSANGNLASVVPEPATLVLLGLGLFGLGFGVRKKA